MLPELPKQALDVLQTIMKAKGQAFYVRDTVCRWLLGQNPQVYMVACSLSTLEVLALFEQYDPILGEENQVYFPWKGKQYQFYPSHFACSSPNKATEPWDIFAFLSKSNFTVHALALNQNFLLDPFGAQEDMQNRLLRCLQPPREQFEKHPEDILHLYRCSAIYKFKAEWNTLRTANEQAYLLETLQVSQLRGLLEDI